ncbi:MAG: TRAP transporter substrate-binding protein [Pirellulales bacterium]|nr:TRAP transporter substrate-binding protein [Pirellulales bacterium]
MKTRRGFLASLVSVLALPLAGCGRRPNNDGQIVLKLGHCSIPDKPLFDAAAAFAEIVQRESNGRIHVDAFGQAALGDSRMVMESTAVGTLDMTCEAPLSPIVPEMALLELPYLFADARHAAENLEGPFGQALAQRAKARDLVVLGYYTDASRSIFNKFRDVRTPDDLHGLKIRVPEATVWLEMMNRFGAMAIPLSWGEVYTAIEQNVIAGAETDLISIKQAGFYETCKHVSETNHVLLVYPHIMHRARFEALSSEDQELLKRACRESARRQRHLLQGRLDQARRELEAAGVTILQVDQQPFRDRVLSMHARYAKKLGAESLLALITPAPQHSQGKEAGKP